MKVSSQFMGKLQSFFETLEKQSKPVPNDPRQSRYCEYITRFASHFGKERVYLTGSTSTRMRLRSHADEGDYDYLIISGISIPVAALEQSSDVPCFVHIRTDKMGTSVFDDLQVDGKFLHSDVLKKLDKRAFEITNGLHAVLTAPKLSQGTHSKHLELNREAKPGISQTHYSVADIENFDTTELYRREHTNEGTHGITVLKSRKLTIEDTMNNLNSAIQSSSLSSNMKDLLCRILCMFADSQPEDFANSLLFQSLGNLIEAATLSEKAVASPKEKKRRNDTTIDDAGCENLYCLEYHYKSSKDFIAAFPIDGRLQCMDDWKQRMENRKKSFWPKEDTIDKIYTSEVYVVAKPAIVWPDISKDFCFGFNQAERLLAESLSPDQRLCMLLLKSLQKGFLKQYSDVLTSFHWNTAFYHKCEEIDPALFNRESILEALDRVLSYMIECLGKGYLKHYFVESNLIAHISPEKADEIAAEIRVVLSNPEGTLKHYFEKKSDTKYTCEVSEKDLRHPTDRGKTTMENLGKALTSFQDAAHDDDSKLAEALIDTLVLVLQKETDLPKYTCPGGSSAGDNLCQLIGKGLRYQKASFSTREEKKCALNELRSDALTLLFSLKK